MAGRIPQAVIAISPQCRIIARGAGLCDYGEGRRFSGVGGGPSKLGSNLAGTGGVIGRAPRVSAGHAIRAVAAAGG